MKCIDIYISEMYTFIIALPLIPTHIWTIQGQSILNVFLITEIGTINSVRNQGNSDCVTSLKRHPYHSLTCYYMLTVPSA